MYTVLRLALAGLEEVRRAQGNVAGGITEETRFPERSARQLLEGIFGDRQTPLSKQEFGRVVLQHRKLVDCVIPGFELIPQDPLHRAAEAGETEEVQHLLEVDQLDPNGEDAAAWPVTPLHLAARYGHVEVASALLEAGANVRLLDKDGRSALDIAVRCVRSHPSRLRWDEQQHPIPPYLYLSLPLTQRWPEGRFERSPSIWRDDG